MASTPAPAAIGVVFDKDGNPKIEQDFLDHLHSDHVPVLNRILNARGHHYDHTNKKVVRVKEHK